MPSYRFYQVDVFADAPFGGNPLAVFPDAEGLTTAQMQHLALELNLSETTFVLPPSAPGADFKVRIFTPRAELPFAGHPLVGTHWVLAHLGRVALQEPTTQVAFELGVGVRAATLHVAGGQVTRVVTDHQRPQFQGTASANQVVRLAQALGLSAEAIAGADAPVQAVSTGYCQLFVPVRSLAEVSAVDVLRLDATLLAEVCEELGVDGPDAAVFSLETVHSDRNAHMRFFAPHQGIPEDPATGSASGGLAAYLVHHHLVPATPPVTTVVTEQGLEMDRPSRVMVDVEGEPDALTMVRVWGNVIPMMHGEFTW